MSALLMAGGTAAIVVFFSMAAGRDWRSKEVNCYFIRNLSLTTFVVELLGMVFGWSHSCDGPGKEEKEEVGEAEAAETGKEVTGKEVGEAEIAGAIRCLRMILLGMEFLGIFLLYLGAILICAIKFSTVTQEHNATEIIGSCIQAILGPTAQVVGWSNRLKGKWFRHWTESEHVTCLFLQMVGLFASISNLFIASHYCQKEAGVPFR